MRLRSYLALTFFAFSLLAWRVAQVKQVPLLPLPEVSTVSAQAAPNCAVVGNNLAVPFGAQVASWVYAESQYTLALIHAGTDQEVQDVVAAINGTEKTIIVRLGAGKTAGGPNATRYVEMLEQISSGVGGKPFIATAGHNEPNCAEYIPLSEEEKYVRTVAAGAPSNVTLITGQIDHTCGDPALAKQIPEYISTLTSIPNIKGLAIPFYITEGQPNSASAVQLFNQIAATSKALGASGGKDIYVTESGPLKPGSMREFVIGTAKVLENPDIKAFLLFNALYLNKDPNFAYTQPFGNPACREAFRTQCQDVEAVIAACGESDPDDYYLYPINGLASRDQSTIFNDLVNQGYEAQCSTPTFYIEAQEGGQIARLKDLIAAGQESVRTSELEATLDVNYVTSTVPLWRDSNPIATMMNSLEDYWGYQENALISPNDKAVRSAPIYSLLNTEQQCAAKVKVLETIDNLCNKLADPSTCALYQPIVGAPLFDTKTLLPAWRSSGLTCTQVGNGKYNQQANSDLVDAVLKVPLYLDKAYRLAFVVMATELRDDPNPLSYFNFMRREGAPATPKHEIKVVAFKIPDIGTNRTIEPSAFQDPLQLTRNIFLPSEAIQANTEAAQEERRKLATPPDASALPVLECGSSNCADPLVKSLVQMINNQQAQCTKGPEAFEYEPSDSINSSGTLTSHPGTEFADGSDPAQKLFTAPADQIDNPQKASFNFLARIGLGGTGKSNVETQVFLIYPMGFELESFEETLLAFFEREWGQNYTERSRSKDYFKVGGIASTLTGGKATYGFYDPQQVCVIDPDTGFESCVSMAESQLAVDMSNREPRILGGRLGFLTRSIQKTMYYATDPILDYLKSCKTTEQFLTGRCKGTGTPGTPGGSGSAAGNGTCETVPTGPCSVANLEKHFDNSGGISAAVKAEKASRICNRESGGNPQAKNLSCLNGGSVDYSIGLFQINLLAHCATAFSSYTWKPPSCTVGNSSLLLSCTENMLNPDQNIAKMIQLSSNGTNWKPWSAAAVCGIE